MVVPAGGFFLRFVFLVLHYHLDVMSICMAWCFAAKWVPTANGIAMQRARILLPLAFLVRVNDTAQHRQWLQTAVDGMLSRRHCENDWFVAAC